MFAQVLSVAGVVLALLSQQPSQTYRVTRVIDGDTVVLDQLGTVRLIGVDTPETVDPRRPVQAFGKEASAFLTSFIGGKEVLVEYDQTRTDRYQRTLAYLYLEDRTFVNLEIVRRGFGHAYTEFPFRYMGEFRAAEREARREQRGLWADAAPVSDANPMMFVTRTGTVYHRAGCREVGAAHYEIPLSDLPEKVTPCKVCRPPSR